MSPQALINGESMAVPEQIPYTEYIANGSTKAFALTFNCQSKDHLIVFLNDAEVLATEFSFSTGSVIFNKAPLVGVKVKFQRSTPFSRSTHYQSYNNSLRPGALNDDFDRLWLAMQELRFESFQIKQKLNELIDIFNNFGLLPRVNSLHGNELMLVSQEEKTLSVTVDQLLNYLSAKLPPPSVIEKPTLNIAALLNQQMIIGNTSAEAAITASIDDSLTANMRADGLEIQGKSQPNSTITVEY